MAVSMHADWDELLQQSESLAARVGPLIIPFDQQYEPRLRHLDVPIIQLDLHVVRLP